MKSSLHKAFVIEITLAKQFYHAKAWQKCFHHLQRAHILGQSYVIPHTLSHWWMLKMGLKQRRIKEVLGQTMRIAASLVFSKIWVPKGNTGGTDVSAFKPMEIPDDLKSYLEN